MVPILISLMASPFGMHLMLKSAKKLAKRDFRLGVLIGLGVATASAGTFRRAVTQATSGGSLARW